MAYRLEALDVLPEIQNLADEMLTDQESAHVDLIARSLLGKKAQRKQGIEACISLVGIKPSRPLFYWTLEMRWLPRNTRDCIRYLGDYIDLLVKEFAFELMGRGRKGSLGSNAKLLLKARQAHELGVRLGKYADFLYNPGKHDFDLPAGRHHRFTAKEVVVCSFITAKLAKEILDQSPAARHSVEKDNLYAIGGKWGSPSRVEYWGDPLERGMEPPKDL